MIVYVLTDDGSACRIGTTATSVANVIRYLQSGNPRDLAVVFETEVASPSLLESSAMAWFSPRLSHGWFLVPADEVAGWMRYELAIRAARYGDRHNRETAMAADSSFRHALRMRRGL